MKEYIKMRTDHGNKARQNLNSGGRVKAADGLWANIHAKRKRIESGSGEKMSYSRRSW